MIHKEYPLTHHDHPGASPESRIYLLEQENRRLRKANAEHLASIRSLRLLAIRGIIYRLEALGSMELSKSRPDPGKVARLMQGKERYKAAYNMIKANRLPWRG